MKIIIAVIMALVLAGTAVMALFLRHSEVRAHDEPAATLSFHSFDGGGPSYHAEVDSDIVTISSDRHYWNADHKRMRGAGYDRIFIFAGKRPGETVLRVTEEMSHGNPATRHTEHFYRITVDEALRVTIRALPADARPKIPREENPDSSGVPDSYVSDDKGSHTDP